VTVMRALSIVCFLALPGSVYSQTHWVSWLGPDSVAVGEPAWIPFTVPVVYDDVTPAAGVPFTFRTEWQCGRFEEGTEMSGVTDEKGQAVSSTYYGVAQDLGCKVSLFVPGVGFQQTVRVFDPASVTMVLERDERTFAGFEYEIWIRMWDTDMGVNAGPPEVVSISQGQTGASAAAVGSSCQLNTGVCFMRFRANDRPGKYDVEFRYLQQTIVVPIKQHPG